MPKTRRPRLSWFRFYADDFLGGTGALTAPECGRYLLLLLHQWGTKERQLVPSEPERLRVICRGEDPGPLVLSKFAEVDGGLRNERLAEEWDAAAREYNLKAEGGGVKIPAQSPVRIPPPIPPRKGPRTKNQEPRTIQRTTDSVAVAPVPLVPVSSPWSREAADDWINRYGGTAPGGHIGKALKPLVEKHGWPEVRRAWRSYLEQSDAEFASASRFASTFGRWSGAAPAGQKATVADRTRANLAAWVAGKERA